MGQFFSRQSLIQVATAVSSLSVIGAVLVVGALEYSAKQSGPKSNFLTRMSPFQSLSQAQRLPDADAIAETVEALNGRPQLSPLPPAEEVWICDVVVVGGTLGGVAAAAHAMQSGANTCLIELSPWLGGQISSQGVSAIDESFAMQRAQNFSPNWKSFKQRINQQPAVLPNWSPLPPSTPVSEINSCWVGQLCFTPKAGATASVQLLQAAAQNAPGSRWGTAIAFKGGEFDLTGQTLTAIYGVRRIPRDPNYVPLGRLSKELISWYSWSNDDHFDKVPIRLEPPQGKRMVVIDATDTGEVVAWAKIPYRVGSDAKATLGETHAPSRANPSCTQAFTFPFTLAIWDDRGKSLEALRLVSPSLPLHEHLSEFDMEGFPMFHAGSLFHYRRIISVTRNSPQHGSPAYGDVTMVNWNKGNDWKLMNPPLIMTDDELARTNQHENWLGGLSTTALQQAEVHAMLFARWLIETKATDYPLTYLYGDDAPMGTRSGLSMMPYIREGRRILGRAAYNQSDFMIREMDIRREMSGGRRFDPTAVALTHYAVDMHGCRYRNWEPSYEANSAPAIDSRVNPVVIPLEGLVPQGIDNLLIGGKSIAVSHIVNAVTRVHYGEWSVGSAAGGTAGWLVTQAPDQTPASIVSNGYMPALQEYLRQQGVRFTW